MCADSVWIGARGDWRRKASAIAKRCANWTILAQKGERMQAGNWTWIKMLSVAAVLIGGAQVGSAAGASPVAEGAGHGSAVERPVAPSVKAVRLHEDMRKLWSDHVIWTRAYMVAAIDGSADASATANRLFKNQYDIGGAVAGFYGKDVGDKLTDLLKQHIVIAVDVIAAAKASDQIKYAAADQRWKKNGEDIADFLSKANPNWSRAALADMMADHLATTTKEVVARLNKKWDESNAAFDEVYTHMMHMSDALADGIIKQFPQKF